LKRDNATGLIEAFASFVYNLFSSLLYLLYFTVLYLNLLHAVGWHIFSAVFYQVWSKIIILALSFHDAFFLLMCTGKTWQWHDMGL